VLGIALLLVSVALTVAGLLWWSGHHTPAAPADRDLTTTQLSDDQRYRVTIDPQVQPPPLRQLHGWTITVAAPDGQPVEGAVVQVRGAMPGHGHGLASQPQVTAELSPGVYLLEGVSFQMGGWWVLDVTIEADGQRDTARFNLQLAE
jgi:hypothetical protein